MIPGIEVSKPPLSTLSKIEYFLSLFIDITGDRRESINKAVATDVTKLYEGKTVAQLQQLEQGIKTKLTKGGDIDVGYWESALDQLGAYLAKQRLRERHEQSLREKLVKLKEEQGLTTKDKPSTSRARSPSPSSSSSSSSSSDSESEQSKEKSPKDEDVPGPSTINPEEEEERERQRWENFDPVAAYHNGRYSPVLIDPSLLAIDDIVEDPEDDRRKLQYQRAMVLNKGSMKEGSREDEFERRARENMDDDEAQFSVEQPIEQQRFLWSDKYKPRKPRFFNRVHTGWEWNKYNQTHYDIDNPPPKVVQGYKFSIFYPDLIDKSKSPEYSISRCKEDPDYCILRFKAGAPYEDLAFKIVNREWDTSHRHGFRCQFNNGIFQLWFHFKKHRYRR